MNLGAFGILAYLKTQSPEDFDYSLADMAGLAPAHAVGGGPDVALHVLADRHPRDGRASSASSTCSTRWCSADLTWLAVIAVIFSAVSAYYYLRVIMYMFFREPEQEFATKESINGPMAAGLALAAVGVLRDRRDAADGRGRGGERLQGHRVLAPSAGALRGAAPTGTRRSEIGGPPQGPARRLAHEAASRTEARNMHGRRSQSHDVSTTSGLLQAVHPWASSTMAPNRGRS